MSTPELSAPTRFLLRAERAEALVSSLQTRIELEEGLWDRRSIEIARLRALVRQQQAEIVELRARLQELQQKRRSVAISSLVAAVLDAVQRGSDALEGRTVSNARAEIKAALDIDAETQGLVLGDPAVAPAGGLSTISFSFSAVPPSLVEQRGRAALGTLVEAALRLQRALDGASLHGAAEEARSTLAAASSLAASRTLTPETAKVETAALAAAAEALGAARPELAAAAGELARARNALSAQPSADELLRLTAAVDELARLVEAGA